tara:strand:- start:1247 stop:2365 length:1119 start_codon:yes stop_codon:yes gene_type:complete
MINKKSSKNNFSIVLPIFNEYKNLQPLLKDILSYSNVLAIEIIVVDDNSTDNILDFVRKISINDNRIRLNYSPDKISLYRATKEVLINSRSEFIAVMDSDCQYDTSTLINGLKKIKEQNLDLVVASRFLKDSKIKGFSEVREKISNIKNHLSRMSLPKKYSNLTDYMSGCIIMRSASCMEFIYKVDVKGFKFLYELLSISSGKLNCGEVSMVFKPRKYRNLKFDITVLWDFVVSLLHTMTLKLLPRKAISFGLVGTSGAFVQLICTEILMSILNLEFIQALPFSVFIAATSNYLINNALTFRAKRLRNSKLLKGLIKFLLVVSLPVIANVVLATSFYKTLNMNSFWSQIAVIFLLFIWNYVASSKFVWNKPS